MAQNERITQIVAELGRLADELSAVNTDDTLETSTDDASGVQALGRGADDAVHKRRDVAP